MNNFLYFDQIDYSKPNHGIQIHHAIFDGYIRENIGAIPKEVIPFFENIINKFTKKTNIISMLKSNTGLFEKLRSDVEQNFIEYRYNIKYDNFNGILLTDNDIFSYTHIIISNSEFSNVTRPDNTKREIVMYPFTKNKNNINLYQPNEQSIIKDKGEDNEQLIKRPIEEVLNQAMTELYKYYHKQILNWINDNNSGIILCGFTGHAVTLYFSKINSKYNIFLFNSGSGLFNHYYNEDSKLFSVTYVKYNVEPDLMKQLVTSLMLYREFIYCDKNGSKFFYDIIKKSLGAYDMLKVEDPFYKYNMIPGQISGSCTYHSMYYVIKYLLCQQLDEKEFKLYDYYISKYVYVSLTEYLLENKYKYDYYNNYSIISYNYMINQMDQHKETFYYESNISDNVHNNIVNYNKIYKSNVSSCTEAKYQLNIKYDLNKLDQIQIKKNQSKINIIDNIYINYTDNVITKLTKLISEIHKVNFSIFKKNINPLYLYVFESHIIDVLVNIIDSKEINQIKSESIKLIPEILFKLSFVHRTMVSIDNGKTTHKQTISILLMLILLIINDNNNQCYLNELNIDNIREINIILSNHNINCHHNINKYINKLYNYSYFISPNNSDTKLTQFVNMFSTLPEHFYDNICQNFLNDNYSNEIKNIILEYDDGYYNSIDIKKYCESNRLNLVNFLKSKYPQKYKKYFFQQAIKDKFLMSIYAVINPYNNDINYCTNNLDDYMSEFGEEPKCNYNEIISKYNEGKNIKCNDDEIIDIFVKYRYVNMFRSRWDNDINSYLCLFNMSNSYDSNTIKYNGNHGFVGFNDAKNKMIFFIDLLLSKKYLEINAIGLAFFEEPYYPKLFNTIDDDISEDILVSVDQINNNFKYNKRYDSAYKEKMIYTLFEYINNNISEIDYNMLSETTVLYIIYLLCNNWLITKIQNNNLMKLVVQYSNSSEFSISFKIIQLICNTTKRNIFDNEIIYYIHNQLHKNIYHIDSDLNNFNIGVLFYKIYLDKLINEKFNYSEYLHKILNNSYSGIVEIDKIKNIINNMQIKTLSFSGNNIIVSNENTNIEILLNDNMEINKSSAQIQEYFKKEYLFVHQKNNTYIGYNQKTLYDDIELVVDNNVINIEKIFNGKKYYPSMNKKSIFSNLENILGVTIMYYTNGKDILIEFPYIFDYKVSRCFTLILKEGENALYYIDDNGIENKIINYKTTFMFNRWINNIPFTFSYIEKNSGKYKILLLDVISKIFFEYFKKNPWVEAYSDIIKSFEDKHDNNIRKFYTGNVSYNGLGVQFDNIEGLELYILFCLFIGKDDCLNVVFDKYIYTINNQYNDKINKSDKYLNDNLIIYLVTNGIINSPYKYYYMNICSLLFKDLTYDKYTLRVNRGVFFGKHRSMTINEYKTLHNYDISRNIFSSTEYINKFNNNKWTNDIILKSRKKIKKLLTEKKGLGKIVPENNPIRSSKNIDEISINTCLQEFEDTYISCENNNVDIFKYIPQITEDLVKFREYILSILDIVYDSGIHELEFICKFSELIYYLLEINLLLNVLHKIPNSKECIELKRLYELIDNESTLYSEKRSLEILFVEVYSGFYIRDEQFKIYQQIKQEIDHNLKEPKKIPYSIYQLLMGRGKTSVIMPLILFNYYLNSELTNILLISPEHLVKQSFDDILSKFYKILSGGIFMTLNANRHRRMIGGGLELGNIPIHRSDDSSIKNNKKETVSYKRIFIISDTVLKIIKLNEIESGINQIFRSFTIDQIKNNSLMIMDEIDNIYNPITSNLNFPYPPKKKFNINENTLQYFTDFVYYVIKKNNYKARRYSTNEINDLYESFPKEKDLLKLSTTNIKNKKLVESSKALFKTINTCFSLLYKKDYGFPHPETHTNMYIAVPYKAQDTPIKNSEYSEADITIILTILTFMYSDLREQDIINIINSAKNKIKLLNNVVENIFLEKIVSRELQILGITLEYMLEINPALDLEKIKNIYYKIRLNKNIIEIKKKYLNEFIIPKITHESSFLNCSAIDIINKNFSLYKCGFSGTAALKLPYWNEYVLDNSFDKSDKSKENYEAEFYKINPINADNGAIYYAILGLHHGKLDDSENYIYEETKALEQHDNIKEHINSGDIIDYIINRINTDKYDVIVDIGAFFIGANAEYIIRVIAEYTNFKYYVFIDENDTKWVYDKQIKFLYNEHMYYNKGELFIFYDNKHIVGIDIKQPYTLKGLATINTFNKLSEVAQGIFRLRHLNYGQTVHFTLHNNISKYNTRAKLLEYLNKSEISHINNNVEIIKLQMNIISQNKLFSNEYYKILKYDIYNEINKIVSLEFDTEYYLNYIKSLNFTDSKLINKLFEKIKQLYNNKHLKDTFIGTNYEQEKQIEEQFVVEINTNLYTNALNIGITNFTFLLTDIKLESYYRPEEMKRIRDGKYYNGNNQQSYFDSFKNWITFCPQNKNNIFDDTGRGYNNRDEIIKNHENFILMEKMNIFMSPIFRFVKIEMSNMLNDLNNPQKQLDFLMNNLRSFDYHYIKILNNNIYYYILLSSSEVILIRQYISIKKITINPNCVIKNKDGHIVFGNDIGKFKTEPTELFVQLILGKKINLLEYIRMAGIIKSNLSDIKNLLDIISKHYGIIFYNEYFMEFLNNPNWKHTFNKFDLFVDFFGKFCNLQISPDLFQDSEYKNIIEEIRSTIQKEINNINGGGKNKINNIRKNILKKNIMY